jgi:hypothetical protein
MRGGFITLFSADEGLIQAFHCLGMNADVAGGANEGWRQLRALQETEQPAGVGKRRTGAPGRIRTFDLALRRRAL